MHQSLFHKMLGVQPAGNGYFTAEARGRGLGDDGSVMMISGLDGLGTAASPAGSWGGPIPPPTYDDYAAKTYGSEATWKLAKASWDKYLSEKAATAVPGGFVRAPSGANTALNTPVKLFNVELPLWAWLAIAALLGGAGGYYLGRR